MSTDARHPLFQKLEPEADHGINPEHAMLASIAVSLKRIADRLDTMTDGMNFAALDNQIWQLGQTFGRGIDIGSRGR